MKRNIEFRFWDKGQDRMLYDYHCGHHNIKLNDIFKDEQLIFQQFTGFKDSVANNIYEGDILKQETFKPDNNEILHWIVSYDEKSASFITKCIEYGNVEMLFFRSWKEENPYSFQVIGNIFENPDLYEK